ITKAGSSATLTSNQAGLSQTSQNPNQPQVNPMQLQPPLFPSGMPQPPQPYIKPAPIPSLPPTYQQGRPIQPGQIQQRGVIQRNPVTPAPTPIVPPPDDSGE